uniref:Uncharacterized protein n=1 Tax=Rhizophora mucronata TaxID=61149 RepID=A0A2P2R176_RHIMU
MSHCQLCWEFKKLVALQFGMKKFKLLRLSEEENIEFCEELSEQQEFLQEFRPLVVSWKITCYWEIISMKAYL